MKNFFLITIFANIKIDDIQRLNRFKKSFFSIEGIKPDLWVINIRGKFRKFAYAFLNTNIKKNKLILFDLNSKQGWFYDTRKMLPYIKTKLVFIWNEDYILKEKLKCIHNIIKDMNTLKIDQFTYGSLYPDNYKLFKLLGCKETKYFFYKRFSKKSRLIFNKFKKKMNINSFIISLPTILNLKTFKKVLLSDHPPLKRWSKYTPFDFEKGPFDYDFLPITTAFPKNIHLFEDIDYDRVGSSVYLKNGKYMLKKKYLILKIIIFPVKKVIIFLRETINFLILKFFNQKYF